MRPSIRKYFALALFFLLWGQLVAHAEARAWRSEVVSTPTGNNNPSGVFRQ